MAHVIKLKYGSPASWSYIDLTDSNHGNVDYYPGTPDEEAEDITESGTWHVVGSSVTDLIAKITAIEQVFHKAAVYNLDEIGAYQVWLTMQPDGVAETWESQVFEGRLELTEDILGVDWANHITDVVLIWRRAPWWELLVDVPVANDNHAAATTGVNVYNWNDKTGSAPNKIENYVDIVAADVVGDLPAPTVIELLGTPLMSSGNFFDKAIIMQNVRVLPSTFVYWQEGETGSSDTTDATRSGGKYHNYALTAGVASKLYLDFTALPLMMGAWFRVLLSSKYTGTIKARAFLQNNAGTYYGPYSIVANAGTDFLLSDLGILKIPPVKTVYGGATGYFTSKVGIELLSSAGLTISVDYFLATPIDGFEQSNIDGVFSALAASDLVMDSHNKSVYVADTVNHWITAYGTMFGGIYLEPNINQRLIFKLSYGGVDTLAAATDIFIVKVHAYIRKRTL